MIVAVASILGALKLGLASPLTLFAFEVKEAVASKIWSLALSLLLLININSGKYAKAMKTKWTLYTCKGKESVFRKDNLPQRIDAETTVRIL